MENPVILREIPFSIDLNELARRTHVSPDSEFYPELARLAAEAAPLGRPKAMYKMAYIEQKSENEVQIDGIALSSRVLRVNLDAVHRVWAFVATCGQELAEWGHSLDDLLYQYWAERIQEMALQQASQAMLAHIQAHWQPGRLAAMNPGSLPDWPLPQQRPLFTLLGDPAAAIGVQLTDSFLMVPAKSVSGIQFATESGYENCRLCPRPDCPGRRAPFDPELYDRQYRRVGQV